MTRRIIGILTAIFLLSVSGIVGYQSWQEKKREQALIEYLEVPSCSNCSLIKKDLAEKVRLNKEKSDLENGTE